MPVEIDQDVDLVVADAPSHRGVVHAGHIHPVIDRSPDPRLRRVLPLDPAVIGRHREAPAVVQFQRFDDRKADGMFAEVRRDIADPQPARRSGPGLRRRRDPVETRLRTDEPSAVVVCRRELEKGVVGQVGERQRRDVAEQILPPEPLRGREGRPFALPHAQPDPVLQHLVVEAQVEPLPERVLRGGVDVARFEDTTDVFQRHRALRHRFPGHRRECRRHLEPLRDRGPFLTDLLEQQTEVQAGRMKVGLQSQRFPQRQDGPGMVLRLVERRAVVEPGGIERRVVRVEGDPLLVAAEGGGVLPGPLAVVRQGEEVHDRQGRDRGVVHLAVLPATRQPGSGIVRTRHWRGRRAVHSSCCWSAWW